MTRDIRDEDLKIEVPPQPNYHGMKVSYYKPPLIVTYIPLNIVVKVEPVYNSQHKQLELAKQVIQIEIEKLVEHITIQQSLTWDQLVKIAVEEYGFKEHKGYQYIYKFCDFIEIQIHQNGDIVFSVDGFFEDVIFSENRTHYQQLKFVRLFDKIKE